MISFGSCDPVTNNVQPNCMDHIGGSPKFSNVEPSHHRDGWPSANTLARPCTFASGVLSLKSTSCTLRLCGSHRHSNNSGVCRIVFWISCQFHVTLLQFLAKICWNKQVATQFPLNVRNSNIAANNFYFSLNSLKTTETKWYSQFKRYIGVSCVEGTSIVLSKHRI